MHRYKRVLTDGHCVMWGGYTLCEPKQEKTNVQNFWKVFSLLSKVGRTPACVKTCNSQDTMSATWRKERSTVETNEIMKTAAQRSESWCWRQILSVLSHVLMLVLTQLVCGCPNSSVMQGTFSFGQLWRFPYLWRRSFSLMFTYIFFSWIHFRFFFCLLFLLFTPERRQQWTSYAPQLRSWPIYFQASFSFEWSL
jgi:hypothetical protein